MKRLTLKPACPICKIRHPVTKTERWDHQVMCKKCFKEIEAARQNIENPIYYGHNQKEASQ